MVRTIQFKVLEEKKHSIRFQEVVAQGQPEVFGSLYHKKAAFPDPSNPPKEFSIEVKYGE